MNLQEIEKDFLQKVKDQGRIRSFFDKIVLDTIHNGDAGPVEEVVLSWLIDCRENRFTDFQDRVERVAPIPNPFWGTLLYATQGTHTVFSWKGLPMFKSVIDMAIYTMILSEVKPEVIIEYGSGNGSSALWLADMCKALGLQTKVFSYDIREVSVEHPDIVFRTLDLANLQLDEEELRGKKLVIEDAHSYVGEVLLKSDKVLNPGDYLYVEDSGPKQEVISDFLNQAKNKYKVDNYYVDFFGINMCSAWNSIFKVV